MTAIQQIDISKNYSDVNPDLTEGRYDVLYDSLAPSFRQTIYLYNFYARLDPAGNSALAEKAIILSLRSSQKTKNSRSSDAVPESIRDNWQRLATSGLSEGLYSRLQKLANKLDGWRGKGSRRLSAGSLHHFLIFWSLVKENAVEPFVTLAPNGHLYAEWHASWKRHLDVEFTDTGDVFYGLFHGNVIHEGREKVSELVIMLQSRHTNPFKWGG